jgi:hypothetical protein
MTGDPELDAWKRQWQARDAVPPDLRQRVEREIRSARYQLVAPIAVTAVFGGGTLASAILSSERAAIELAAITWGFITITWLASIILSRRFGQRRIPAATTATAFMDFAIQNCRSKPAGITAVAVLASIFMAFMLAWRYQPLANGSIGAYLRSVPVLVLLGIALVLGIVGLRMHRALGAELDNLRERRRRYDD